MIDPTEAFFARLAERGYEPLLHSVSGTSRWDIKDTGSWFVAVENGSLNVSRDAAGADCVFACSKEDFDHMGVGKQNSTTLSMQGRKKVTRNPGLRQLCLPLFP